MLLLLFVSHDENWRRRKRKIQRSGGGRMPPSARSVGWSGLRRVLVPYGDYIRTRSAARLLRAERLSRLACLVAAIFCLGNEMVVNAASSFANLLSYEVMMSRGSNQCQDDEIRRVPSPRQSDSGTKASSDASELTLPPGGLSGLLLSQFVEVLWRRRCHGRWCTHSAASPSPAKQPKFLKAAVTFRQMAPCPSRDSSFDANVLTGVSRVRVRVHLDLS